MFNPNQWFQMVSDTYGGAPNTFIGGVASVINTPALLAAKFLNYPSGTAFSAANIQNFTIVGDDIECYITKDFVIIDNAFSSAYFPDILTYFIDDGYLKGIGDNGMKSQSNLAKVIASGCLSIGGISFQFNKEMHTLYTPNLTDLGGNVFSNVLSILKIYVPPALETANAGSPHGDIVYLTDTIGGRVSYVANFTAPNPITDLSIGNVYGTALQLNFTAPTGSANAIDYYECYANGVYKNKISGSGNLITGLSLNTSYDIEVKPVDIYYNRSTSNIVTQTTASSELYPVGNIVSYYKMENNVLDGVGANNGTATDITYEAGLVGQRAIFNGTTSKIVTTNDVSLLLTTGSIVVMLKATASGSSYRAIVTKENAYGLYLMDGVLLVYNWGTATGITTGNKTTGINLNDGLNHIIVITFQLGVVDGTKIYIDNVLRLTTSIAVLNQNNSLMIGTNSTGAQLINAQIDEPAIFNSVLTVAEVSDINAKLNSGQALI